MAQQFHLTYCSNIHPGETWDAVRANVRDYGLTLKRQFAPDAPFGLGLHLTNRASLELFQGGNLADFRAFLDDNGLYVHLLNGFPYGAFHNRVIKSDVFAPDWHTAERVDYTLRLVQILAALVPAGMTGGVSTLPLSYKRWQVTPYWALLAQNIARVASEMARVREGGGPLLHLDIEPEPDGLVENSAELVDFLNTHLLAAGDEAVLREHVRVCYDTCHFALQYEAPQDAIDHFTENGWKLGRVQVSAAIQVPVPPDAEGRTQLATQLSPFAESTYLHQTIGRRPDGSLRRYPDLADALPLLLGTDNTEWRVHFHVPLFAGDDAQFPTTQAHIRELFAFLSPEHTPYLEIETYTWDVLPPALKTELHEFIAHEYRWVQNALPRPVAF